MKTSIMTFMGTLIFLCLIWAACDSNTEFHKLNKGDVSYYTFDDDSLGGGFVGPTNEEDTSSFWYVTKEWMWNASLSTNCQEIGGYLFMNNVTGEMTLGKITFGQPYSGSLTPGSSDPKYSGLGNDWAAVAYIHTHPASDCLEKGRMRGVGPSDADQDWANRTGYPVLTIDYSGTYNPSVEDNCVYDYTNRSAHFQWYNTYPIIH